MKKTLLIMAAWPLLLPGATLDVSVSEKLPVVDGALDEAFYKSCRWSTPLYALGHESETVNALQLEADAKFKKLNARFALATDGKTLVAGIEAPTPKGMSPASTGRFGSKDDFLELFLSRPGGGVWQMIADAEGRRLVHFYAGDTSNPERREIPGFAAGVRRTANGFTAEFSVPLAALGFPTPVKVGSVLRGNVTREGPTCGGLASWANVGTYFNTPDRFGEWFVGGGEKVREARRAAVEANKRALDATGLKLVVWPGSTWSADSETTVPDASTLPFTNLVVRTPGGTRAITSFSLTNRGKRDFFGTLHARGELAKLIRFREVAYYESVTGAMVPDPIHDLPAGWFVRVPAGKTVKIWTDIAAREMKAGRHAAEIEVHPGLTGFAPAKFQLALDVSPVRIGDEDPVAWAFGGGFWATKGMFRDYGIMRLGLTPNYVITDNFSRFDKVAAELTEMGVPKAKQVFSVWMDFQAKSMNWGRVMDKKGANHFFGDPYWKAEYTRCLRNFIRHFTADLGYGYENLVIFTVDEPNGDPTSPKASAYYAVEGAKFLKSIDPKLRLWTDPYKLWEPWQDQFVANYDSLYPDLPYVHGQRKVIETYGGAAKAGKDVGSYSVLTKNTMPKVYRIMAWSHMRYGFRGTPTFYDLHRGAGDPYDSYDGGAVRDDHCTLYHNGRTGQYSVSIRMESWYEGLIDLRLYHYAQAHVKDAATKARLAALVKAGADGHRPFEQLRAELLSICESCR